MLVVGLFGRTLRRPVSDIPFQNHFDSLNIVVLNLGLEGKTWSKCLPMKYLSLMNIKLERLLIIPRSRQLGLARHLRQLQLAMLSGHLSVRINGPQVFMIS